MTVITVLAICVSASVQGAEKGDAILETIPADAIFCVRINNLNQTTGVLDQYITGISPMPISTSGLVKSTLGMMFGNIELKGFDTNASFAVFATAEKDKAPNIFFLLPVTEYKQLLDPNFRVSQPDTNGISTVGTGPAGQFYISPIRSFALMSKDYGKLSTMASLISGAKSAGLSNSLYTAQITQASSEPIWCYANMVKVSEIYGGLLCEGFEEFKKHAADPAAAVQGKIDKLEQVKKQIAAADPNNPGLAGISAQIESLKAQKQQLQSQKPPAMMAEVMDVYGALLKDFMQQTKSVTLTCNPRPSVLNLKATVNALAGTEMARMLTADAGTVRKNNLTGFTEDGAAMNFVGRTNKTSMKKMYAKFIDLFAPMTGKDPNSPDIVKVKKLCVDMVDSMGELVVCTFSIDPNAKPPFDAKYVLEVKDANLFNRTMDEFAQTWAGSVFGDFYKNMGMETNFIVKHGVDNYKGISIDGATFGMKFTDMNLPEAQMLNTMYGRGFDYRWAIVDGLWVCRVSSDPNAIYKLIDQVKAGPPAQACLEMQNAMKLIPRADNADVFCTINYLRLMRGMLAFSPMPFSLPDIPTKSNLAFAAKVDNGTITIDIAAPKDHIIEMSTAFRLMMQQQMQQPPQGMPMQPMPSGPGMSPGR